MIQVKVRVLNPDTGALVWELYYNGTWLSQVNQEEQLGRIIASWAADLLLIEGIKP